MYRKKIAMNTINKPYGLIVGTYFSEFYKNFEKYNSSVLCSKLEENSIG